MEIVKNYPLKDKNWFGVGGPAEYFCEPQNEDDFIQALTFAKQNNLDITFIGLGANMLISDEGIKGPRRSPTIKKHCI